MPDVRVQYVGILRVLAGTGQELFAVDPDTTLRALLVEVARRHGRERVGSLLFTEGGALAEGVVILLEGGEKIDPDRTLSEDSRATIVVLSPLVAGG